MKMATALSNGRPALWCAGTRGYHCVSDMARAHGRPDLESIADVGQALESQLLPDIGELVVLTDPDSAGSTLDELDLLPPVLRPRALMCVGRNYAEHVAEGNVELPAQPLLFAKFTNTLAPHRAVVPYPQITSQLDYEGELAVVIGRRARQVSAARAAEYIAGYTIINDISARDLQESDMQWIRGKSLDGFAPLGPCVVTADEVPDVDELRIQTRVNGELRQDAKVGEMHFKIPYLLEFITQGITLEPGDVLATGTPAGVGLGFVPPRFLSTGDVIDVSITGMGTLNCRIG